VPDHGLKVGEIAVTAALATHALPPDVPPGSLEAVATYDTPTEVLSDKSYGNISVTYSGAAHACRVKVDPETGRWEIVEYVMAHDSGNVINPLIVDGQHQGGFLHGFGMVYGENLSYDPQDGKLLNATFGGYAVPYAPDTPSIADMHEIPAPSRSVVGGRKGAGETATAPVPPAVANALYHATGIRFTQLPITPDRVLDALHEKERRGVDRLMYPYDVETAPGPHTWPGEDGEAGA
jgi:carbon-monoxide dehydrogenase large subunit